MLITFQTLSEKWNDIVFELIHFLRIASVYWQHSTTQSGCECDILLIYSSAENLMNEFQNLHSYHECHISRETCARPEIKPLTEYAKLYKKVLFQRHSLQIVKLVEVDSTAQCHYIFSTLLSTLMVSKPNSFALFNCRDCLLYKRCMHQRRTFICVCVLLWWMENGSKCRYFEWNGWMERLKTFTIKHTIMIPVMLLSCMTQAASLILTAQSFSTSLKLTDFHFVILIRC